MGENRPAGQQASRPAAGQRAGRPAGGVASLGEGWYLIGDGETTWRVAAVADSKGTWLFFAGQVAFIERDEGATRRGAKGRGDSSVMAPMPASVVSINTSPGASVKEGDTVIVLEAMKMELPIKAPRGGIVKAIHCEKGELVQPGVNLLEIE